MFVQLKEMRVIFLPQVLEEVDTITQEFSDQVGLL